MRKFEEMILDFVGILERMGIDYVIVGGVAVSSWGTPRTTRDLDVIIALEVGNIDELSENLHKMGFSIDKNDFKKFVIVLVLLCCSAWAICFHGGNVLHLKPWTYLAHRMPQE
jgi:hypothetical protein